MAAGSFIPARRPLFDKRVDTFMRVRIEQAQAEAALVVPQQAVTRGSTGDTVMVVAADGKVSVTISAQFVLRAR